jgi:hypothetical protein
MVKTMELDPPEESLLARLGGATSKVRVRNSELRCRAKARLYTLALVHPAFLLLTRA